MIEIGRYRRTLPVGLDRMFENALDWAHLPYLHADTFSDLSLIDSGGHFWRARVRLRGFAGLSQTVRLTLDPDAGVWITTVEAGVSRGMSIHTTATATGPRQIAVDVRFRVPKRRPWNRVVGRMMADTYRQLYDEDEAMMVGRQAALDRVVTRADTPVRVGTAAEMQAPGFTFEKNGRPFAVTRLDGEWVAYAALCPHLLGPLQHAPVERGVVECPWHGYRFDIRTRQCVEHRLELMRAPTLTEDPFGVYWA